MSTAKVCAGLLMACALGACGQPADDIRRERLYALGTVVDVVTWDLDESVHHHAVAEVADVLRSADTRWNAWQGSELATLNRDLASRTEVPLSIELGETLARAQSLGIRSGGLFDPTLGNLIEVWGFHEMERAPGPPPPAEAISAALPVTDLADRVQITDGTVRIETPGLRFDLGGFAKGLAAAEAADHLRAAGIAAGIVNLGGDLCAWGRPGDRPWRIAIRHPRASSPLAELEIESAICAFTSGDYERYFEHSGERYHHILDPRSGFPATGAMSVTVLHEDAALADAAATALLVAGAGAWESVAGDLGVDQVMLVAMDGRIYITPRLARHIIFLGDPPEIVIVGETGT